MRMMSDDDGQLHNYVFDFVIMIWGCWDLNPWPWNLAICPEHFISLATKPNLITFINIILSWISTIWWKYLTICLIRIIGVGWDGSYDHWNFIFCSEHLISLATKPNLTLSWISIIWWKYLTTCLIRIIVLGWGWTYWPMKFHLMFWALYQLSY